MPKHQQIDRFSATDTFWLLVGDYYYLQQACQRCSRIAICGSRLNANLQLLQRLMQRKQCLFTYNEIQK